MDFTQLTPEQRRSTLEQEIANLEHQLWSRDRDVQYWRAFGSLNLEEAAAVDSRVLNNQKEESKQQLAAALLDCAKVRLKLEMTQADLAKVGTSGPKA